MMRSISRRARQKSTDSAQVQQRKGSRVKNSTYNNSSSSLSTMEEITNIPSAADSSLLHLHPASNDSQEHDRLDKSDSPFSRRIIERIQAVRVPLSSPDGGGSGVPLISGLDTVAFGTVSAAEAVTICGFKPSRYAWFLLSGGSSDVIQLIMDMVIHSGLGIQDASVCWTISYFLSIIVRHSMHRYLVFGMYVGSYCSSLIRIYVGYSASIALSFLFNAAITQWFGVPHYFAFLVTMLWTGVVNYIMLKRLWSFRGTATGSKTVKESPALMTALPTEDLDEAQINSRDADDQLHDMIGDSPAEIELV